MKFSFKIPSLVKVVQQEVRISWGILFFLTIRIPSDKDQSGLYIFIIYKVGLKIKYLQLKFYIIMYVLFTS